MAPNLFHTQSDLVYIWFLYNHLRCGGKFTWGLGWNALELFDSKIIVSITAIATATSTQFPPLNYLFYRLIGVDLENLCCIELIDHTIHQFRFR